jgi:predicted acylesterase/phospholipase RssA
MSRLVATVLAASLAWTPSGRAQQCPEGPVALVLSGGGAKGYAHVGVLHTLDSLRIRPDLIVGTSMGAILGALYASGYSAREIDSLVSGAGAQNPFRRIGPHVPRAWGALLPLLSWEQGDRGGGIQLRNPAVREASINAYLSALLLRGNLLARGTFDSLPIPFRVIATDLGNREAVVLSEGDLARSVRASVAIPLVFSPIRVSGRVLLDGGLSANVPVRVARQLGARRLIVSDVTERQADTMPGMSPLAVADQLMGFLFTQPLDSLGWPDVYIRPDIRRFRALDFTPVTLQRLDRAGRRTADSVLAASACFARARPVEPPRLPSRIASAQVTGGHPGDQRMLTRTLGLDRDSLDAEVLRERLLTIGTGDPFEEVWLSPGGRGDSVRFDIRIERAPRRVGGAGVAYDSDLSGRFWAGVLDRRLAGVGVEMSLVASVGRFRDDASLALRRTSANAGSGRTPLLRLFGGHEKVRAFDSTGRELSTLPTDQARIFLGLEQQLGGEWLVELGGEGMTWENPDGTERSTLGASFRASFQPDGLHRLVSAEATYTGLWRRAHVAVGYLFEGPRLRLEPMARVGWGRHLPIHERFALGGEFTGFPGLRYGERRADREALLAMRGSLVVKVPVSLRFMIAAGRSADGGSLFDDDRWLAGVRAGVGLDTPLGPLAMEYGVASDGSGALFFRVGRWF